jgi:hypothetical protein
MRISGAFPTPEMVSRDCLRTVQSEFELLSAHSGQKTELLANTLNFLEARFWPINKPW